MRRQLLTSLRATACLLVLLCGAYPLAVWGVGRLAFSSKADGSFVTAGGRTVGSKLIGQSFADGDGKPLPQYFQPRPSAAGGGYDAGASSSSNLGPSNPALLDAVARRVADYRALNGLAAGTPVPVDAVTASGSGLDPDISVANARLQAPRVAAARGVDVQRVLALVDRATTGPTLGVFGEKAVNVLELNLSLDRP